jgi:dTDP-4-amino-4,6-dideoxygalactose transaminase
MERINRIAKKYKLFVVEDAAHAIGSKYKNRYLGTIGNLGAYSFHESKNLNCGEGGAIILNDNKYFERAEIIREKGTNRSKFIKGEIDKYTWVDVGSSYLMSEILAASLYAQLKNMGKINNKRVKFFKNYFEQLQPLQKKGIIQLPTIPQDCMGNGHLFYLITQNEKTRNNLIKYLKSKGIGSVFHYIPLHSSPMGISLGAKKGELPIAELVSRRLLRLPLYYNLTSQEQSKVIKELFNYFQRY